MTVAAPPSAKIASDPNNPSRPPMIVLGTVEARKILAAMPAVTLQRPQPERVAGELLAQSLAVPAPQLLSGEHPPQGAPHEPRHHQWQPVVEPDEHLGPTPHQVA